MMRQSTADENKLHDQEVLGSSPERHQAFFSINVPFPAFLQPWPVLNQVPQGDAPLGTDTQLCYLGQSRLRKHFETNHGSYLCIQAVTPRRS